MPHRDPADRRAYRAAYRTTPSGRAEQARYRASPTGQAAGARANARAYGHNVRPEGRAWMLEQQGGACAVVGCDRDATCVDHDHETGEVRGLLCNPHNRGLGLLGDNRLGLQQALQYLPHE